KTKVLAAHAKITDVLFAGDKFPIGIEPSPVPSENIAESVSFDPEEKKPEDVPINTITRPDILEKLGPVREALMRIPKAEEVLKEEPGTTPTSYTWEPAKEAARNMEKKIHDQLLE